MDGGALRRSRLRAIPARMKEVRVRLGGRSAPAAGRAVRVLAVEPLAGGACQDNLKVDLDPAAGFGSRWVLRSDARSSIGGSIDRAQELSVIRAAVAAGVKTPQPRWPATGLVRE